LGKEISSYILITVAFLALLSSFPGFFASAQPQATSFTSNVIRDTTSTSSIYTSTSSTVSTSMSTTSSTSYTSTGNSDPTVTVTSTATAGDTTGISTWTHYWNQHSTGSNNAGYSITFSPTYWLCTDVSVTFTGPLVESGFYGDTLQFQYFQYNPSSPSVLTPIFTDPSLTVTSDTVNYWVNYNEYASANFEYMPNIAVKVVDVTPKSNGYTPGQIFFQLTNIIPEGSQYCQIDAPIPTPEFQADWIIIMVSLALGLTFLRAHNHEGRLAGTKKYPQTHN
jgi:hypothetical protein